jgi:hypothetical protein
MKVGGVVVLHYFKRSWQSETSKMLLLQYALFLTFSQAQACHVPLL